MNLNIHNFIIMIFLDQKFLLIFAEFFKYTTKKAICQIIVIYDTENQRENGINL